MTMLDENISIRRVRKPYELLVRLDPRNDQNRVGIQYTMMTWQVENGVWTAIKEETFPVALSPRTQLDKVLNAAFNDLTIEYQTLQGQFDAKSAALDAMTGEKDKATADLAQALAVINAQRAEIAALRAGNDLGATQEPQMPESP